MLALFPKISNTGLLCPKPLKIDAFDYPILSFDVPSPGNPPVHIRINLIYCQKLESLGYIFAADSMGLSSFFIQILVMGGFHVFGLHEKVGCDSSVANCDTCCVYSPS